MKKHQHSGIIAVPLKVLETWQMRHMRGDILRIQQFTKLSRPTILKALNYGKASNETILAISKFYAGRKMESGKYIESEALKILSS